MKRVKIFIISLSLLLAAMLLAFKDDLFQISKNVDVFVALYKEININYVEETNAANLIKKGIDGMLNSLDPYTEYVPSSEIEAYKLKYVSAQYGGVGISTITIKGRLFINEIIEGYAAYKNKLLPGDEIIEVNNIPIKGKERTEISAMLRGAKGSSVDITILRNGQSIKKSIIREEIRQPNVSYSTMLDKQTGYIKLDKFLENSAQEVRLSLNNLLNQNAKNIILDLRNNGGGILQEAVKIVNLFVDKGQLVVSQKGKNPEKSVIYNTASNSIAPNIPLIVLINRSSASASEIVAGAIQDLDRGVIIGQASFGKGLVQQTFNLPYNGLVKVTVAKYYTPSGRCIQALDYAHRQTNGKVLKFSDSSINAFNTSKGRIVYDGKGISPDISIEAIKLSPITITLANKSLFFDFANAYWKKHPHIGTAAGFKLSDADYNQFIASINEKDYTYSSKTENLINELNVEAKRENKAAAVKSEIDLLKLKLLNAKKSDFTTYKDEIKRLLETQIISRYYYEKGKIEQSFQYDKEIEMSKNLFDNKMMIANILKGVGNYKIIGQKSTTNEEQN